MTRFAIIFCLLACLAGGAFVAARPAPSSAQAAPAPAARGDAKVDSAYDEFEKHTRVSLHWEFAGKRGPSLLSIAMFVDGKTIQRPAFGALVSVVTGSRGQDRGETIIIADDQKFTFGGDGAGPEFQDLKTIAYAKRARIRLYGDSDFDISKNQQAALVEYLKLLGRD